MNTIDEFLDSPQATQPLPEQPRSTIDDFLGPVERPGIIGTLAEGFRSVGRAAGSTFDTVADYAPGVVERAREQADAPKAEPLEKFYADIEQRKASAGEDPGLLDALGVVGGAVLNNPKGAGYAVLEQAPNALAALGPAWAGMKLGGTGGAAIGTAVAPGPGTAIGATIGGVVGGIAGLFSGNAVLEVGHKAMEAAQDGTFTADEQDAALREGATKAGVITGVDVATLGASKWITGATSRAVERATTRALTDAGVDVTNEVAVLAARRQPEIVEAVRQAQQAAVKTTSTFGQKAARAGGALALETVGEGLGEYLGELAATGQADMVDAVLESVLSLGQSGAEVAWGTSRNAARAAASQLDPSKGPISRAAIVAVDQVDQQAVGALPSPDQLTAAPVDQDAVPLAIGQTTPATIETFLGAAPAQSGTATPTGQPEQAPAKLLPLVSYAAATQRAASIGQRTGTAHVVITHPVFPDRYAVVPEGSAFASNAPTLDVDNLFSVQVPVPLKNAKRLVGLLSANGTPHAIVPSPTGRGFGVAPLEQLSPDQREAWARFQPGTARGAARVEPGPVAAPPEQHTLPDASNVRSAPATPIGTPGAAGQLDVDAGVVLSQQTESALGIDAEVERAEPSAAIPDSAQGIEVEIERAEPDLEPLDHGELNIPGRTNGINAELDRWKADQAKQKRTQAKTDAATRKAQKAEAKRLFGQHGPAMIEKFAPKFGRKELEAELDSMVKWEPAKFIDLAQRFEREQAAAVDPKAVEARKVAILERMNAIERAAQARADQGDATGLPDYAGSNGEGRLSLIDWMTQTERETFEALRQQLPSSGEEAEAARIRIAKRLEARRSQAQNASKPSAPEGDPYDNIETRPDTTDKQREAGRSALRALLRRVENSLARRRDDGADRGAITLLGSGFYDGFTAGEANQLVGQVANSPADLAALAQVYRDPRFETFRVFFVKNGRIVGENGYSSRLPAAVRVPPNLPELIRTDLQAFGADGYYLLHNHPSGRAEPSVQDVRLTNNVGGKVPGLLGHIVIDFNEYSVIQAGGKVQTVKAPELAAVDFQSNPELKHDLLGTELGGPPDVVKLAKALQIPGGHATLVLTRRQGQVQVLADLPQALLEDGTRNLGKLKSVIRAMSRESGSGGHRFIVLPDGGELSPQLGELVSTGVVTDVVSANGQSMRDTVRWPGDFIEDYAPVRQLREDATAPYPIVSSQARTIEVDGVERPTLNSAGDPTPRFERSEGNWSDQSRATYSFPLAAGETTLPPALLADRSKFGKARVRLALRRARRDAGKINTLIVPDDQNVTGLRWLINEGLVADVVSASDRPLQIREPAADFNPARASVKDWITHQLKQNRGWAMGALTRDQIADLYAKDMPQVDRFDRVVQHMDLVRNRMTEQADALVERWRKLADADQLADVMHSATLAQFDPDQHNATTPEQTAIVGAYDRLSLPAQELYRDVRDQYRETLVKIRDALVARVERSGTSGTAVAADIRLRFDRYLETGPYFSLARFGDFILIADKGDERIVQAFESSFQREQRAKALRAQGFTVKLTARQEYSATKDGAAGSFIGDVLEKIDGLQIDAKQKADLMDGLNQLAIGALPDASYRKHFAHRKGTPGFSNDAMRAFAASQMHAAHHLARIRHADELAILIDEMREEIRSARGDVDVTERQQVVNELTRRLDLMLNPNTHPVTAALGQLGFIMSLGGSIASGLVNLTQTPLVTFPWLGAKFGFDAASGALLKASKDYFGGKWNRWSGFVLADNPNLADEERRALRHLEEAGLINLTQAADLAGTANTDSTISRRAFVMNRAMKIVGWTFHTPEVFNRQVSALAAYRLAREAGQTDTQAIESARQALIRTHFDYSSSNRARLMSGNVMRVLTMFKQYSQQMSYLLWRNAYLALKGESADVKREARRMLVGVASMHFAAAGSLGLPLGIFGISPMLALLSMGMGGEDEPFDWETEYRNALHDVFGKEGGEAIAKGPLRLLLNVDLASRVGLGDLWIRPPQKDAEGRDLVEAWMITLLGPVAGYAGQMGTAAKAFEEGQFARGVESMLPKFIASPLRAVRYETEGVRSWNGTDLGITLSQADIAGVAAGFQPAKLAEMYEGRNAVKGREAALQRRREDLMRAWREARDAGDEAGVRDVVDDIRAFNTRNRAFGIGPAHLRAHLMAHRRAQLQTAAGIHLSRRRDELRDVGRFANID